MSCENIDNCGERRKSWLPAFSPFPSIFMTVNKDRDRYFNYIELLACKSMGESNTVVSAYTRYRHLQQYCSHPSKCFQVGPVQNFAL